MAKVAFNAQLKKVESKLLVDGTLSGRVVLEGVFPLEVIQALNEVQGREANKSFEIEVLIG